MKHLDEARIDSITSLREVLERDPSICRAAMIDDLFGRIRLVVWVPRENADVHVASLAAVLENAAGPYWSGEVWQAGGASESDRLVYDRAWDEGRDVGNRLRVADRLRNRTAWFHRLDEPPWTTDGRAAGPPVVAFYSFKGGVGRSTALAAFAIQRARAGERVAVIDFDLDAPGVGTLLASDERGAIARLGVVDFLLERRAGEYEFGDYHHPCRRLAVTGAGEIRVVPAGRVDSQVDYLRKLARVDLDLPSADGRENPLCHLVKRVRDELDPHWILVDGRAGLGEPAGLLLSGLAHLHILFGASSEQSWLGLRLIIGRLGAQRVTEDRAQAECAVVQAMVPEDPAAAEAARGEFAERSLEEFRETYYAADPEDPDDDRFWYVRDSEDSEAPHQPVPISYRPKLARFTRIEEVADELVESPEYRALGERIAARAGREVE